MAQGREQEPKGTCTDRVGVDGGSEKRLGQGDVAQFRLQVEGIGYRVGALNGVCNLILQHSATSGLRLCPEAKSFRLHPSKIIKPKN